MNRPMERPVTGPVKHQEDSLSYQSNHTISYQHWSAADLDDACKGVIVISHGLAEHSGRYKHVAEYFVSQGYHVYAIDHLGHGKSSGARCHVASINDFVACLHRLIKIVKDQHNNSPVYLLGHSMGGLIASLYLIDHQQELAAAILSAPLIKPTTAPTKFQTRIVKFFARFFPKVGVLQLDPRFVSRDPKVVKDYIDDPLVFSGKVSAKLSMELGGGMAKVSRQGSTISLPILILQGKEDKLVDPAGAEFIFNKVSSKDKSLEFFDQCYHEILNEPEQQEVLSTITTWLAQDH